MAVTANMRRMRIRITGTVQGVGFRPFVYRLAGELALAGWVRNDERGVEVEVEGSAQAVEAFRATLRRGAPAAPDDGTCRARPRRARVAAGRAQLSNRTEPARGWCRCARCPRCRYLLRLPGGAVRSGRPPFSLSVRQLHQL